MGNPRRTMASSLGAKSLWNNSKIAELRSSRQAQLSANLKSPHFIRIGKCRLISTRRCDHYPLTNRSNRLHPRWAWQAGTLCHRLRLKRGKWSISRGWKLGQFSVQRTRSCFLTCRTYLRDQAQTRPSRSIISSMWTTKAWRQTCRITKRR